MKQLIEESKFEQQRNRELLKKKLDFSSMTLKECPKVLETNKVKRFLVRHYNKNG